MAPKRDATEAPSAALLRRSKRLMTDIGAVNEAEELLQAEEENDLEETALSGVDGIKERNVEEETLVSELDKEETQEDTKTIRREQIEISLKEMGLLPNIFGQDARTNCLHVLVQITPVREATKEEIRDFAVKHVFLQKTLLMY
ncbi:hypothetical protein TrVFT333_001860 [Trichoderma virens FT-333]|nr:hypothetical protein TrVFT333_001860 [Trichoderma virens FT-333]